MYREDTSGKKIRRTVDAGTHGLRSSASTESLVEKKYLVTFIRVTSPFELNRFFNQPTRLVSFIWRHNEVSSIWSQPQNLIQDDKQNNFRRHLQFIRPEIIIRYFKTRWYGKHREIQLFQSLGVTPRPCSGLKKASIRL